MQQRPTHPRLHVRDVRDALTLLEAVRIGVLSAVKRRLNDAERTVYVRSGSVFVWEESDDDAGIKRWTDGCMWSQSRMREPFLFYEEKVQEDRSGVPSRNRPNLIGPPASHAGSSRSGVGPDTHYSHYPHQSSVPQAYSNAAGPSSQNRPAYGPGLVKQAYSAYVTQPGTNERRKFHLTAYFTYADLPNLPTLESEPLLCGIVIPQGVYRSGKSRTSGRNLASAAEPIRSRQNTGRDSSPSPTSSPSSSGHSFTTSQSPWSSSGHGMDPRVELSPSAASVYPYHHSLSSHSVTSNPAYPRMGHPLLSVQGSSGSVTHSHSEQYTGIPRLPPVTLLPGDTDSSRRNRDSEDDRVIQMLNSRPFT